MFGKITLHLDKYPFKNRRVSLKLQKHYLHWHYTYLDQIDRKNMIIKKKRVNTKKSQKHAFICLNLLNMQNKIL